MKKQTEIKYPNSANLFQFCRRVLDHKFGGIRVIDQDVGQILGFDPADCSHWKKGKKNIRSIQAMKSIAEHLGVDEKLVVDIASGEIDDNEAFYEYSGYGTFDIDTKVMDAAKKDFYRKNASTWTREKELEFKSHFEINEPALDKIVTEIHDKISFSEAPLYLPEVVGAYQNLRLTPVQNVEEIENEKDKIKVNEADGATEIKYLSGREIRPYMRFRLAKEIGKFFIRDRKLLPPADFNDYAQHIVEVQSNLFAAKLLTPISLIRKEMVQINVSRDIISQLSEIFWVSKTFMNARLREILQSDQLSV